MNKVDMDLMVAQFKDNLALATAAVESRLLAHHQTAVDDMQALIDMEEARVKRVDKFFENFFTGLAIQQDEVVKSLKELHKGLLKEIADTKKNAEAARSALLANEAKS